MKKYLTALLGCGALSLAMAGAQHGSTPMPAQAAEQPVPLTATIHLDAARYSLAWTEWELVSPVLEGATQTPFLKFTDVRLGAGVGLNAIGGEYSIDGGKISVRHLLSTRMAGPPPLMAAEDRFVKALQAAQNFEISDRGKTLTLRGDSTLTFRLTARTPQGFVPAATKIINVAPQLGPQMDGDKTPKYLQLEDLSPSVGWGRFTAEKIEGFQFEPGYRYQLRVAVERDPRTDRQRLRLLEIFSQQWMESSPLPAGQKILEVAPATVACEGGAAQCLQVREAGESWQKLPTPIAGFDYQPGWRYRLQVVVAKNQNLPADSSHPHYTLVRLLDRMPVTY